MEYKPLGKTGLTVSVAGLGCGGNSRLGLRRGASFEESVAIVRTAVDLGVNFIDTAEAYGTEEIVGAAARHYDRDRLVISTKAIFRSGNDTADAVTRRVEAGLKRLGLDYVDIFHFHAVSPATYSHHRDVLAPAQQQQVAKALEHDAEVMTNTQLEKQLAGQPADVQAEIVDINTDARPRALQVALLIPAIAALLGLLNSFRMLREPEPTPSAAAEGMVLG